LRGWDGVRAIAAGVAVMLLWLPGPLGAQTMQQPVLVDGGLIRGIASGHAGIEVFKGVPYAASPVNELRWRAPQSVVAWQGVRAADHFSRMCMQKPQEPNSIYFAGFEVASEDCLYLNVWTPAKAASEQHAVMVWIYGGGFREGSAAPRFFDGADLAAKGVVVVSFNYRVGAFGFLAHPELTAESGGHGSGDYGLLDQIAALTWVRDNIAKFGGDASRVTVFGQSAGGASASALVASPLAKGLIHGAISESGQLVCSPDFQLPLRVAEENGVRFAKGLGADSIAALRKVSAADILNANGTFRLVVDGYFLPSPGAEIFDEGRENRVPVMMGSNSRESHTRTTLAKYRAHVQEQFGDHAEEFLKLYPASNDDEASAASVQSTVDEYAFVEWEYAKVHTESGKSKAYLYYFGHNPPVPEGMYSMKDPGAYHGAEIDYVFDHLQMRPWPWTEADRRLAETMSDYWVNFAETGDPNGKGLPVWPVFNPARQKEMLFNDTATAVTVERQAKFKFFEENKALLYPAK
jgi:para-nitrobenzyl esterase